MTPCEAHAEVMKLQLATARELGEGAATMKSLLDAQEVLFHKINDLKEKDIVNLHTGIQGVHAEILVLTKLYGNGWQKSIENRASRLEDRLQETCDKLLELDKVSWFGKIMTDFRNNWLKRIIQFSIVFLALKSFSFLGDLAGQALMHPFLSVITRFFGG